MISPKFRKILLCVFAAYPVSGCGVATAGAQQPATPSPAEQRALDSLPPYHPGEGVAGTIRLWGHGAPGLDFMGMLVKSWEDGFRKFQPGVHFEYDMYGTASAMGALYTGRGDIAILGQEIYPFEVKAFEQEKHYPPTEIEIATGSVDIRNFDYALGPFVRVDNPLQKLTLDQLDKIFAYHDDPKDNILTWDQLGLTGPEWKGKPIHLYGWYESDIFSTWIEHAALHGSHRWRCGMKQYAHIHRSDGSIYDSGQQILDDLSHDRYGIGLSSVRYMKGTNTRPLLLARGPGGPYYSATKETLINRQYPLARFIPAEIDRAPGHSIDPALRQFLLYLLSRDGQQEIVRNGKYLPMQPEAAAREREKLQ
jgi:phosphate transport system substrate-binding protein